MSGQIKGHRPQGGNGSNDNNEDIKKKLEETIKAAQKALDKLSINDGGKQRKPPPKRKQNTRGSKSMVDLSSANKASGKSHAASDYRASNTNTRDAEFRPSPLLPNPPPLMGINPQFMNPMWNAAQTPFLHMNAHYNPYYGNFQPPVSDDINALPPSYASVPSQSNVAPKPHGSFGHGPPPPSYEDTVKNDQQVKQKVSKPKLSADNLVKTLALFNGHFGTAEMLARQIQVTPEDVINCAKVRKDLFALMGEGKDSVIELVPKVSLCTNYISDSGCEDRQSCMKLHICKSYVTDTCKSQSCSYGHRWDTTHNSTVLSKLYLDLINPNTLYHVIRKVCKGSCKLQICNNFNSERGCKNGDDCRFMHICKGYVSGQGKCPMKGCPFNHNLASQQCTKLIKNSGVPAGENRQEILAHLLSSLERENASSTVNRSKSKDRKENKNIEGRKKNAKERAKCNSSSNEGSDSESSDDVTQDKGNQPVKKKERGNKNKNKVVTVVSSDVLGDVEIAEICLFAIDNACRNTKNGCKYLHAKSLFQWQVEKDGKWYNLRVFQSKALENAYRDVSKGATQVPALDESKLEEKAKELLNILGTAAWKADFQSMTMSCKGTHLKVRRVSTQSSVLSSSPKATVYEWYFQDKKGKWIQYGEVDSLGNQFLVCSVSSDDIEKAYLSSPSSTILISSAHYKYKLDFSKMTQMNLDTKKEREIRRRPSRLSYQKKKASEHDPSTAIPPHWNQMANNQTHLLVPLDPKSHEYQEVASCLRLTLPTANIQKIQRLQNPYLWRLFQYKKVQLSQRYDDLQLNVQKLFHGTNVQSIDTICKENFDWRQGIAVQQSYGQGTYFSNSAATARGHCTQDNFGRITMFLAQVIIGMVAKGDPSLTRPPSNPSMNALYDTTVDDITAPTVFVKYDKEEYYPEYVIEFY